MSSVCTVPLSEVYLMDCMELMRLYPDKYFDLAVVDPPYGININMNMGRKKGKRKAHNDKKWDTGVPDMIYFSELFRVSQNQIIWGGNYFDLPLTKSWIFGTRKFLKMYHLPMESWPGLHLIKHQ